jgi:hypothetical protein
MESIDKQYGVLAKKYRLPEFSAVDSIFEISSIEKHAFPLREIRRKISDKLDHYVKILEGLINPETTIGGMHECKYFDDDEKKKIFDLYRKLMAKMRESDIISLSQNEKDEAGFISEIVGEWPALQKELAGILAKLKSCWAEEEVSDKEIIEYFG